MGCDIHAFIETKNPRYEGRWDSFADLDHCLCRNYSVFSALAGVRTYSGITPEVPPRGLPEGIGPRTFEKYFMRVLNEGQEPNSGDYFIDRATAEKWVADGISEFTHEGRYVTDPDAHTPSWLTTDELKRALSLECPRAYKAVLAAMESIESNGYMARLVFWFDN